MRKQCLQQGAAAVDLRSRPSPAAPIEALRITTLDLDPRLVDEVFSSRRFDVSMSRLNLQRSDKSLVVRRPKPSFLRRLFNGR